MFVANRLSKSRRRGIVLVLILAMLGLLALIGVTFATFSGQSQVGARYYAEAKARPDAEEIIDFALAQLVDDTDNPTSAAWGHSLRRDMYGNDSASPGVMYTLPDGTIMTLTYSGTLTLGGVTYPQYATNIPNGGTAALASLNLQRWIVRLDSYYASGVSQAAQTLEVLSDDIVNGFHYLTTTFANPNGALRQPPAKSSDPFVTFKLDGRFRRAFNGPGLSPTSITSGAASGYSAAALGNFLFANYLVPGFTPDTIGMDEDYDAADLDNWFLAAQSADGTVVQPSFHRPGILTATDWTVPAKNPDQTYNAAGVVSRAKILRPRKVDHPASGNTFPDLVPDSNGKITYDVDNDGDGVTDSVWMDFGFPIQRDFNGKMYKPLFAVMAVGTNGRFPLNTAGNMQGRNSAGQPTYDHTSHIGYSANEINPKFAFSTIPGGSSLPDKTGAGISDGTFQLNKLLQGSVVNPGTGYYDLTNGRPVDGRWGESDLILQAANGNGPWPRAGRAASVGGSDDNFTAVDFLPNTGAVSPESADYFDATGSYLLPSERTRHFVTPVDISGNGRIIAWKDDPTVLSTTNFGTGFDNFGRSGFFHYFRPPGAPNFYDPTSMTNTVALPEVRNNPYHGYESFRNPIDRTAGGTREQWGAMPWNNNGGSSSPTFIGDINSGFVPSGGTSYALYPDGTQNNAVSLGRDEAAEMNLYRPNPLDAPFGPHDLEWLYRKQDVDGDKLQSRLAQLLPEAFVNASNNIGASAVQNRPMTRRRLFGLESWETNGFAWTPDNPGNSFGNNSNFTQTANASYFNLSPSPAGRSTPTLAHRDRRINLNQPLPISSNPLEPVRQKWITDAYRTMKSVLPPMATDTVQELAAIGQFCVNIVDFRDTDATITAWQNPDVVVNVATSSAYSTLAVPAATSETRPHLIHFGMEYQPVAINEVLAYSFMRRSAGASGGPPSMTPTPRFYLELVNTLTKNKAIGTLPNTASNLDLNGWDVVVLPDTSIANRPDVFTGQVPSASTLSAGNNQVAIQTGGKLTTPIPALEDGGPNAGDPFYYVLGYDPPNTTDETKSFTISAHLDGTANNLLPTLTTSTNNVFLWVYLRRPANPFAAVQNDPTLANYNPIVVVDSMRIPYTESGGRFKGPSPNDGRDLITSGDNAGATPKQDLYSVERLQPFRGGQLVPNAAHGVTVANAPNPKYAYGYTEQTNDSNANVTDLYGNFGTTTTASADNTQTPKNRITAYVKHTLGKKNSVLEGGANEKWSPFVFNDRDFQGVAELLLVPGCPPGLFTKQFVEDPPFSWTIGHPTDPAFPYVDPPTTEPVNSAADPTKDGIEGTALLPGPVVYPYLPDNFYYTAANDSTSQVGGLNGAGWHRMLEFFEVPTTAHGAIGPVADGENLDWYKHDVKPGLVNLNLIFDQEVFLGLIDDPRLNTQPGTGTRDVWDSTTKTVVHPRLVTQVNSYGYPTHWTDMRAANSAFRDFIKLRHGGSGFVFAYGSGAIGSGYAVPTNPVNVNDAAPVQQAPAVERPFHSLSYPDINFTLMRPATLPPSAKTTPVLNNPAPTATTPYQKTPNPTGTPATPYAQDPGLKNPYATLHPSDVTKNQKDEPVWPPAVAPRRMFEVPDGIQGTEVAGNASVAGDSRLNTPTTSQNLANPSNDLFDETTGIQIGAAAGDNRRHPLFRTELMQKLMNLTTVRTHQYAVWVTVGFFEVDQPGNPRLAGTDPVGAVDRLGVEIGAAAGKNVRYRSFFLIDRTTAGGFDPSTPGDFREVVTYRRRIQ